MLRASLNAEYLWWNREVSLIFPTILKFAASFSAKIAKSLCCMLPKRSKVWLREFVWSNQKPFPTSCEVSGFWLRYQSHVGACQGLGNYSLLRLLWFPHSWRQCIAASLIKRVYFRWICLNDVPIAGAIKVLFCCNIGQLLVTPCWGWKHCNRWCQAKHKLSMLGISRYVKCVCVCEAKRALECSCLVKSVKSFARFVQDPFVFFCSTVNASPLLASSFLLKLLHCSKLLEVNLILCKSFTWIYDLHIKCFLKFSLSSKWFEHLRIQR